MEEAKIFTLEKQILHAACDNTELLKDIETIDFSPISAEILQGIWKLNDKGLEITKDNLVTNSDVDPACIMGLFNTEYNPDELNTYIKDLKVKQVIAKALDDFNSDDVDIDKLKYLQDEINKAYDEANASDTNYYTFKELLEMEQQLLEDRKTGTDYYIIGDSNLQNIIPKVRSGIISIVGYSGSTKSTCVSHLALSRIKLRLPTTMINTELAHDAFVDGLCAELLRQPYNDICGISGSEVDFDTILEELKKEIIKSDKFQKFALYKNHGCSVKRLIDFNRQMRKEWKLNPKIPIFCICDLASMLSEFNNNTSKAAAYEDALNDLNTHCLEDNICLVATWQLKRKDTTKRITCLEDLLDFEPTLAEVKNSGAIEERSRVMLSIFNQQHTLKKQPHDEILEDICSPEIRIKVLKNSYGDPGKIAKVKFSSTFKCYDKWTEEDEEFWNTKVEEFKDEQATEEAIDNGCTYQDAEGNWLPPIPDGGPDAQGFGGM